MNDERCVISKKEIIIYFFISIIYVILAAIQGNIYSFNQFLLFLLIIIILCLPSIIGITINKLCYFFKINNENIKKIIKILFNIFVFINIIINGFILFLLYQD